MNNNDGTHTVTIIDGNGQTSSTIIKDGKAAAKGDTGAAGKDGKNAEAKVVNNNNGTHTVTIVDGNGQTTSTVVKDGKSTEGKVERDETKGTSTITINNLDKDGTVISTTTAVVKDGEKGKDGENGISAEGKNEREETKVT